MHEDFYWAYYISLWKSLAKFSSHSFYISSCPRKNHSGVRFIIDIFHTFPFTMTSRFRAKERNDLFGTPPKIIHPLNSFILDQQLSDISLFSLPKASKSTLFSSDFRRRRSSTTRSASPRRRTLRPKHLFENIWFASKENESHDESHVTHPLGAIRPLRDQRRRERPGERRQRRRRRNQNIKRGCFPRMIERKKENSLFSSRRILPFRGQGGYVLQLNSRNCTTLGRQSPFSSILSRGKGLSRRDGGVDYGLVRIPLAPILPHQIHRRRSEVVSTRTYQRWTESRSAQRRRRLHRTLARRRQNHHQHATGWPAF